MDQHSDYARGQTMAARDGCAAFYRALLWLKKAAPWHRLRPRRMVSRAALAHDANVAVPAMLLNQAAGKPPQGAPSMRAK